MAVHSGVELEDWSDLAVPHTDGRDTQLLLCLAERSPLAPTAPPRPGEPTCFGGQVALRPYHRELNRNYDDAPPDHPHIAAAEALLKTCWPEVHAQFGALIHAFHPVLIRGVEGEVRRSNSHQPKNTIGSMWATVNNPIMLAQALVHELAHNKLFALGQHFEPSPPLFANDVAEGYDSPVRLDIPRPISAVFHGVYAFTHVLALDRRLHERQIPGLDGKQVLQLLHHNAWRIRKGIDLLEKCALPTDRGRAFLKNFYQWAGTESERALELTAGIKRDGPIVVMGPACKTKSAYVQELSRRIQVPVVDLEAVCWDVWWQTGIIRDKLLKTFGSRELLNMAVNSPSFSKNTLMANWIDTGFINPAELDGLKLQLAAFLLKQTPNAILDFGTGMALIQTPQILQNLKDLLCRAESFVFLVRPLRDLETTVRLLAAEVPDQGRKKYARAVRRVLTAPCYRMLADYVLDSESGDVAGLPAKTQAILEVEREGRSGPDGSAGRDPGGLVKVSPGD